MCLNACYCTIKSRNDMKAVERVKIKALIIQKPTYFLIKWPQLISRLTFSKLRPNFFLILSPVKVYIIHVNL